MLHTFAHLCVINKNLCEKIISSGNSVEPQYKIIFMMNTSERGGGGGPPPPPPLSRFLDCLQIRPINFNKLHGEIFLSSHLS